MTDKKNSPKPITRYAVGVARHIKTNVSLIVQVFCLFWNSLGLQKNPWLLQLYRILVHFQNPQFHSHFVFAVMVAKNTCSCNWSLKRELQIYKDVWTMKLIFQNCSARAQWLESIPKISIITNKSFNYRSANFWARGLNFACMIIFARKLFFEVFQSDSELSFPYFSLRARICP